MRLGGMPGGWTTHRGYSLLRAIGNGELDLRSREWSLIKSVLHTLAKDQGTTWEDLSQARQLISERAAFKALALSCMERWALEHGIVGKDGQIASCLRGHYLAFANSLRHDLLAIGIERLPKDVPRLEDWTPSTPRQDGQNGTEEPSE